MNSETSTKNETSGSLDQNGNEKRARTRTKSSSLQSASEIEAMIFDNICHYPKESNFTKLSEELQLDGFKNFIYLALIVSCGRTIFENLSTYGFASSPIRLFTFILEYGLNEITLYYLIGLAMFPIGSLVIERLYVSYLVANQMVVRPNIDSNQKTTMVQFNVTKKGEQIFRLINTIYVFVLLFIPTIFNQMMPCNPFIMSAICLVYSALFLKLYSYHETNRWWRTRQMYGRTIEQMNNLKKIETSIERYIENDLKVDESSKIVYYPENLNLHDILYFAVAPTMCYQINFPKKSERNWWFIARCVIETILLMELQIVLIEQWIYVPLEAQKFMLRQLTLSEFILKWTKMSLGTITIWLIGFYSLFQSISNLIAELILFADREFYRDWWNAKTISEFWRSWNIPIHRWCVRHLLKPLLIEGGVSSTFATFAIFLVSGIFHEYVISVPLGMFCVHFIIAMVVQQPFDAITCNIHKTSTRTANSIVWLSLILGQPFLILLYYNDVITKMRVDAVEQASSLLI